MKREKTTQAVYKSIRFNPINTEDAEVLRILEAMQIQGFNFKQVVVDAILARQGYTPEMFTKDTPQNTLLNQIEGMLNQFAQEIVEQVQRQPVAVQSDNAEDEGEITAFSQNFVKSFLQRNQQGE